MSIADNLAGVRRRIARAAELAGRDPDEITLVCVSKYVDVHCIRQAYDAGARDFGENYAQNLREKAQDLADLPDLRWHFIGGLQRNKVKVVIGTTHLIHSVDSAGLVQEIDRRAAAANLTQDVLVQLNLAGEATKSGITAEELPSFLENFAGCTHCRCAGLMTMPPFFDEPQRAGPFFSHLRELQEQQAPIHRPGVALQHLSMGMSGDFEAAIQCGATLIRVGTSIFGARQNP